MRTKAFKRSILSIAAAFTAVASPLSIAQKNHIIEGFWKNDQIGLVDVRPCDHKPREYCAYAVKIPAKAAEQLSQDIKRYPGQGQGVLIVERLKAKDNQTLDNGRLENINSSLARRATIRISYKDSRTATLSGRMMFFHKSIDFTRPDPQTIAPFTPKSP